MLASVELYGATVFPAAVGAARIETVFGDKYAVGCLMISKIKNKSELGEIE